MGDQAPSLARSRCEPARGEHDVVAHRVRVGIDLLYRSLGSRAGMDPHSRKVVAEALFHILSQRWVERAARARENIVYAAGYRIQLPACSPRTAVHLRRYRTDRRMNWHC